MTFGRANDPGDGGVPTDGSVSTTYLLGVVHFAEQCGVHRGALLDRLGPDAAARLELHADADERLPLAALRALFSACADLLNDAAFALRFGVGVPCAQLTLASALAAAQPSAGDASASSGTEHGPRTLRDALHGLNRYASLGVDFGSALSTERYRFVDEPDGVWLEDLRPAHGAHEWPALTESVFARFATGIRRRGGERIVRAVDVTHQAPGCDLHRDAYHHVFRVPVRFGAARNALCLDPAFLERPLEPLATPVAVVLTRHADAQLTRIRRTDGPDTWRARVESLLSAHLEQDSDAERIELDIGLVCREMAVSRQTLHRRLRAEGTSFAALHDHARRAMADRLLRMNGVTIGAVAWRLGFSEAAAFSRAYKRWTGHRPGAVRS